MTPINSLRPLSIEDIQKNAPYRVGSLFTLKGEIPYKRTLPCVLPNEWVFNQGGSDLCAGCASANASAVQEGVRLDPAFSWMLARQNDGMRVDEYGANNRSIADAHRKYGAIELKESPYTFEDRDTIADPTSWDIAGLLKKSVYHKKGGVVWVHNYDEARQAIERLDALYKKPHTVVFGLKWAYNMTDHVLEDITENGSGHDALVIDWEGDYALLLNSYGLSAGEMGVHRMHRRIFDRWATEFGAFIFIDETEENVKWAVQNGVKLDGNWLLNVLKAFTVALLGLLAQLKAKTGSIFKEKVGTVGSIMLWDTPAHIRYNVRVMCDNSGLTYAQKVVICACISVESGFQNYYPNGKPVTNKNMNSDGTLSSTDWGVVQCNDRWNIGKGKPFPSVEYVMANPQKLVQWMIDLSKVGKLTLWSSYKFGAYKRRLLAESVRAIPY